MLEIASNSWLNSWVYDGLWWISPKMDAVFLHQTVAIVSLGDKRFGPPTVAPKKWDLLDLI